MSVLDGEVMGEDDLARLARCLALKVKAGDCIALHGDLGAGKTTFARAFIRAVLGDGEAEVPSPTFPIEQIYDAPRFQLAHYDLYRLSSADEVDAIGFGERTAQAVALIEWPDRAGDLLPLSRIDLMLEATADPATRQVRVAAVGAVASRMVRAVTLYQFIDRVPDWRDAAITFLDGDASTRAYARLKHDDGTTAILMDAPRQPDGPPVRDGKPYSRIAHLAEDVRPFVAVQAGLLAAGLAAPKLLAHDLDVGLLLCSDLGDLPFGRALTAGHDQGQLWSAAVDTLVALRRRPFPRTLPLPDGTTHTLPRFDRAALEIEIDLMLEWYWPHAKTAAASDNIRHSFRALWSPLLDQMRAEPAGIFLRDYHSPNLLWRPEQQGLARVGVIDFQDALAEPWAYDLVSLLQDARVDVTAPLEARERARYVSAIAATEPEFDRQAFLATYARFGLQRNTRLIGLWVRLLKRDGKPGYMQHMARTWDYVARNLAHPALGDIAVWYEAHFPAELAAARARSG
jgi:N-acetylmuramate 1-kinase